MLQVLNKCDLLPAGGRVLEPGALAVSGMTGQGIGALIAAIDAALVADPLLTASFRIPQAEGRVIASLERGAIIEQQSASKETCCTWS